LLALYITGLLLSVAKRALSGKPWQGSMGLLEKSGEGTPGGTQGMETRHPKRVSAF
jgi:hypothetical protein